MRKRITAILMTGLLVLAGCSGETTTTTGASSTGSNTTTAGSTAGGDREKLIVGMEANYAPYNWAQPNDANGAVPIDSSASFAGGYDVMVAKALAEHMDRDLVIKQIAWEGLIPAVQNGSIDLIIAGMSVTPDRAESVDFSAPYYDSKFVMLVREGGQYAGAQSLADFSGARIIGQKSTNYDAVIPQIPDVSHETPLATVPLIVHAIISDVADGTVVEKPVAISVTAANPELVMVEFSEENGFQDQEGIETELNIAMEKGSTELKSQVDEFLNGLTVEERDAMMDEAVTNQP